MTRNEFLRKWYDALRSGKFKQDYGRLRSDRGYCCLGVACSISKRGKWEKTGYGYLYETQYTTNSSNLPNVLAEDLGLSSSLEWRLTRMNDSGEYSFKKIAAFIRKKFPEAFKSTSRKISR